MRKERVPHDKGWLHLASLLIELGQFDKAQQVYNVLLKQLSDESEKVYIYNMIGNIQTQQGEYQQAIVFYEKSLFIQQEILPTDLIEIATICNNVAILYDKRDEYSIALFCHEKACEIYQKTLPSNHPHLAYFL